MILCTAQLRQLLDSSKRATMNLFQPTRAGQTSGHSCMQSNAGHHRRDAGLSSDACAPALIHLLEVATDSSER